ncbi:MAG: hypothetical protein Q4G58_17635 [bacterium]|nr:hypothetical protein [bacterium]
MDDYSFAELPIGFAMKLAQDVTTMDHFAALSAAEKEELVAYIQGGNTGDEAEERVREALLRLH